MANQFHLLITPRYYTMCLEYGLFGVGRAQMNQIANVRAGDLAFIYTAIRVGSRTRPQIFGPFRVISEPFYNDTLVWAPDPKAPKKDKYPYRVKIGLTPEHVCANPLPVQRLWDMREEGKVKSVIDASALTNKSVINLLPNEGRLVLESILQFNPRPAKDISPYKGHGLEECVIDPCDFIGTNPPEFRMESQLETYLLQNRGRLDEMAQFSSDEGDWQTETYNQVSTYIAGGAIDIIVIYRKRVFDMLLTLGAAVFELKKGVLEEETADQPLEYLEWTARLLPGLKREMIHGVLVGRDFGTTNKQRDSLKLKLSSLSGAYRLSVYTYRVGTDARVHFAPISPS